MHLVSGQSSAGMIGCPPFAAGRFRISHRDVPRPGTSRYVYPRKESGMTPTGPLKAQAGTYIKVTTVPGSPFPESDDSYRILYLRPSGRFLFLGYWSGFEYTSVVGRWSRSESGVELRGYGVLSTDTLPHDTPPIFIRTLTLSDDLFTPTLVASTELDGWSLLGWQGNYSYVGSSTVVNPDGKWLPSSIDAVDAWINERLRDGQAGDS